MRRSRSARRMGPRSGAIRACRIARMSFSGLLALLPAFLLVLIPALSLLLLPACSSGKASSGGASEIAGAGGAAGARGRGAGGARGSGRAPSAGDAAGSREFGPAQRSALESARLHYSRGDYSGAFEAAKKALTAGKESAEAYALISRIYMDASQDRQAAEFFSLVAEDLPCAQAWYFVGFHQFRLNRWDEAAAAFRRAAEMDPSSAELRFREGLVLQARGDFPGAVAALAKARELDPSSPLYAARLARLHRITGDYAAADRLVSEALSRSPGNGELLYASAQLRLREGKTREAEALLREAIAKAPDLREAHYDLARVLSQKGEKDEARAEQRAYRRLSDYTEGLQTLSAKIGARPGDSSLLLTVAEMHLTERRWEDTLRVLARAEAGKADPLRVASAKAEAHYGSRAPALGDEDLATAEKALGGRPPDASQSARLALARAAGAVARSEAFSALPLLGRAAGTGAPEERLFLLRVADAYRDLGRPAEAEALYQRAKGLARPE